MNNSVLEVSDPALNQLVDTPREVASLHEDEDYFLELYTRPAESFDELMTQVAIDTHYEDPEIYRQALTRSARMMSSLRDAAGQPTSVRVFEVGRYDVDDTILPLASSRDGGNTGILGELALMQSNVSLQEKPTDVRSKFKQRAEDYIKALPEEAKPDRVTFDKRAFGRSTTRTLKHRPPPANRAALRRRVGDLRADTRSQIGDGFVEALEARLEDRVYGDLNRELFMKGAQGLAGMKSIARRSGWSLHKTFLNVSALGFDTNELGWQSIHMEVNQIVPATKFIEDNYEDLKHKAGYLWLAEQAGWSPSKTFLNVSALGFDTKELGWQQLRMEADQVVPATKFIEDNFEDLKHQAGYLWLAEQTGWGLHKTFLNTSALGFDIKELGWQQLQMEVNQVESATKFIEDNFEDLKHKAGYLWLAEQTGWSPAKTFLNTSALGFDTNELGWQAIRMEVNQVESATKFIEDNFEDLKHKAGYLWLAEQTGWSPAKTFKNVSALGFDTKELGWKQLKG